MHTSARLDAAEGERAAQSSEAPAGSSGDADAGTQLAEAGGSRVG